MRAANARSVITRRMLRDPWPVSLSLGNCKGRWRTLSMSKLIVARGFFSCALGSFNWRRERDSHTCLECSRISIDDRDFYRARKRIGSQKGEAKGAAHTAEVLVRIGGLPASPAVDDAGFDSGIILPGANKVGVKILHLDQPQGYMLVHFVVGATSQSHREGIGSASRAPKMLPTEEHVGKRGQRAIGTVSNPWPKQVIHGVGADPRRKTGYFAVAKVPDRPEPIVNVTRSGYPYTRAARAARIEPDVLITAENLRLRIILRPAWNCRNKHK